eukprot:CAMPEP_0202112040 /NCGR_PEP_ID=MMETSP0965-20130614/30666_1 /ASSEMBLY_ACC=CAM_ASM_000507 /TAXON_ID=4773 /ORGANISM="Schizochytrium aggregatum, Strain ATCC28209" /LENGTH=60 /DNA_ID=CAMNT_0048681571 /DNA_START=220 /DNA_END=399 /DNA_ORIENTATION=+
MIPRVAGRWGVFARRRASCPRTTTALWSASSRAASAASRSATVRGPRRSNAVTAASSRRG